MQVTGAARVWGVCVAAAAMWVAFAMSGASSVSAQDAPPYDDVQTDAYFFEAVEALAGRGVFMGTECEEGFCPGTPVSRATMAVWTVRVLEGADPGAVESTRFADVDAAHRYSTFIERLAELGVTSGCGDGTRFCPDRSVTRAQMAVFLSRAFDLPAGPDPGFGDVPADAWFASEVAKLAASGITAGCGDGTSFCPSRDTTRAQMAVFLARAIGLVEIPTRDPGTSGEDESHPAPLSPGTGAGSPSTVDGDWVIPVFVCAAPGKYTTADLQHLTAVHNERLDGFFARLSSQRMTLRFTPGAVLTDDIEWNRAILVDLVNARKACGEEAIERAGTRQVLIFVDTRCCGGIARLRHGPAFVALLAPGVYDYSRTTAHELGHSVLGLLHLKRYNAGNVFANEGDVQEIENYTLACYQYELLGWTVPQYARPCVRLSPSLPTEVTLSTTDDDLVRVSWEPPTFTDNVPVTDYTITLYAATSTNDPNIQYEYSLVAEFNETADARVHVVDPTLAPGDYVVGVSANSQYGKGDESRVSLPIAAVPAPFGPIRVTNITSDSIQLLWNSKEHEGLWIRYDIRYTGNGRTSHRKAWGRNDLFDTPARLAELDPDTEYTIEVRACNQTVVADACTDWQTIKASTATTTALPPPGQLSASAGSDWYLITWNPVPGAGSYVIDLPGIGELRQTIPEFSQSYGIDPGTPYTVRVRSCRSVRFTCEDGDWAPVTFTTAANPAVPPPHRIALRETGGSWVTLWWESLGGGPFAYRVEYEYTDGNTDSGTQDRVTIPLRLATEPNKTYTIKIRNCERDTKNGACSTWTSLTFSTSATTPAVAPPSLRVTDLGEVWFGLAWNHVPGTYQYDWRYKKTTDSNWVPMQTETRTSFFGEASLYVGYQIDPGTDYMVAVRSCAAPTRPCSPWTTTALTTASGLPAAPSSYPVSVEKVTASQIHLAWDPPQPGRYFMFRVYPTNERGATYVFNADAYGDVVIPEYGPPLEPNTPYTIAVRTCPVGKEYGFCDEWVAINVTTRPGS